MEHKTISDELTTKLDCIYAQNLDIDTETESIDELVGEANLLCIDRQYNGDFSGCLYEFEDGSRWSAPL